MTTTYDETYPIPSEVEDRLERDTDTLYYGRTVDDTVIDAYLTLMRERSRAYRVVNEYHRKARKARATYARERRKY